MDWKGVWEVWGEVVAVVVVEREGGRDGGRGCC